jgi:hypothetical protein
MVFGGFIGSSSNTNYFWLGGSMNWAVVRGTRVLSDEIILPQRLRTE